MTPQELSRLGDRVARARLANTAPITFARCPIHGSKIARDGEGSLLGVCDGCAADCADALKWLKANEHVL